jgi:uncharacterized protein YdaU (DUF1376 family)
MGKPPAFQFYANDFLGATITWDAIACGMYIRLLCTQWVNGSIPDDQRRIAKAAGVDLSELQREWHLLEPKFPLDAEGTRKNLRLEEVRQRQSDVSNARKEAANTRWNSSANASAKPLQRKVKEKVKGILKVEGVVESEIWPTFQNFWDAYERKGNRKSAEAEWQRTTQSEREAIMQNVPAYNASKPDKQFRKDGERYLKHRVWEDAITQPTKQNNGQRTESDILAATLALAGSGNRINGSNLSTHEHADGRRE